MKVEKLLTKAKKESRTSKELEVVKLIIDSLDNISDCKKTLKRLQKEHNKLLKTDIDDLELSDFEY